MKIAVIIARVLMGLIFVFFGLNGFLQFLKAPMPTGLAGEFLTVLSSRTMFCLFAWRRLWAGCFCW